MGTKGLGDSSVALGDDNNDYYG